MTQHTYGDMVGDAETGGIVNLNGTILLNGYSTVAIENLTQGIPAIALRLADALDGGDE